MNECGPYTFQQMWDAVIGDDGTEPSYDGTEPSYEELPNAQLEFTSMSRLHILRTWHNQRGETCHEAMHQQKNPADPTIHVWWNEAHPEGRLVSKGPKRSVIRC